MFRLLKFEEILDGLAEEIQIKYSDGAEAGDSFRRIKEATSSSPVTSIKSKRHCHYAGYNQQEFITVTCNKETNLAFFCGRNIVRVEKTYWLYQHGQ